jgi:aldose 1-epimerase
LQLYIPPSRRSIAIETLSGAPDAFNNGIGLILLDPGTSRQFSVTYEVA